ncbi:MAG: AFG1 family ATPase [Proteobacteria bacterium]|nr:AFG1 family ATPase [Pseudomonadota bacterium]
MSKLGVFIVSPIERYEKDLKAGLILPDPIQLRALQILQSIYQALTTTIKNEKNYWGKMKSYFNNNNPTVKGAYLWGKVGVGKTYLMNLFYHSLPFSQKLRIHFYAFMQEIHDSLKQCAGEKNPLKIVAKKLAAQTRIICFDEFFVSDIADAMILANLFEALFLEGVTLVATSNIAPDDLYKNGLQRTSFLPAIELIKQNTQVLHLETENDYRAQDFEKAQVYFTPLNSNTDAAIQNYFQQRAHGPVNRDSDLMVQARNIHTCAYSLSDRIAWFDFKDLCAIPRSQNDYLEITDKFSTIILSNVPKFRPDQDNEVTYFIDLVDICYDKHCILVISAACEINELYLLGRKSFEFQRTHSRLLEMQSLEYQKPVKR